MARLQILELPGVFVGEASETPFVLVVDEYMPQRYILGLGQNDHPEPVDEFAGVAEQVGARGILVFQETVDIPANDTTAYLQQVAEETGATIGKITSAFNAQQLADERTDIARDMDRLAKRRDGLADALGYDRDGSWDALLTATAAMRAELTRAENARDHLRNDRDEARSWARHGYEIGQKHCSWTDHGVAPAWLTEGWPPHIESCEHLQLAAQCDEAISRVRSLHRPVEHGGITICAECSGWDGSTTDNSPCGYEHCTTLKALAAEPPATSQERA